MAACVHFFGQHNLQELPEQSPQQHADKKHDGVQPEQWVATGFATATTAVATNDGTWGIDVQGVKFNAIGNVGYKLINGNDYSASVNLGAGTTQGGFNASLGDLMTSYEEFDNKDKFDCIFIDGLHYYDQVKTV